MVRPSPNVTSAYDVRYFIPVAGGQFAAALVSPEITLPAASFARAVAFAISQHQKNWFATFQQRTGRLVYRHGTD